MYISVEVLVDVEGISSNDILPVRTNGSLRGLVGFSWLRLGRFSVGILPVTRSFLLGAIYNIKQNDKSAIYAVATCPQIKANHKH